MKTRRRNDGGLRPVTLISRCVHAALRSSAADKTDPVSVLAPPIRILAAARPQAEAYQPRADAWGVRFLEPVYPFAHLPRNSARAGANRSQPRREALAVRVHDQ